MFTELKLLRLPNGNFVYKMMVVGVVNNLEKLIKEGETEALKELAQT